MPRKATRPKPPTLVSERLEVACAKCDATASFRRAIDNIGLGAELAARAGWDINGSGDYLCPVHAPKDTCETCGKEFPVVAMIYAPDPLSEEMSGNDYCYLQCQGCYDDSKGSI